MLCVGRRGMDMKRRRAREGVEEKARENGLKNACGVGRLADRGRGRGQADDCCGLTGGSDEDGWLSCG